ncbi:unnamed protein product [Orchesella dallaii]|uniref:Uncharacterized protein n=1 Tax=Orchesella dallaii TaxID=48710 RepID=A0ABP1QBC5_9HEXA
MELAFGAVQEGTEAKELINSYPQTAENYPRAVEALIDRYGRDDLQLQFYVRELLTLVITNVTNKDKLPLSTLQLKLESHLRSLATLKLDQADPATWLFPLVESSLAEDTLRAWQRSPLSKFDGSTTTPTKTRLELLMDFLQSEVRTEQQISLAQSAFQSAPKEKTSGLARKGNTRPIKMKNNEEIATAAGLMSGLVACAFCDGKHYSDRCIKAQIMSYPEKREKVESKRLCFKCLRPGHSAKKSPYDQMLPLGGTKKAIDANGYSKRHIVIAGQEIAIPFSLLNILPSDMDDLVDDCTSSKLSDPRNSTHDDLCAKIQDALRTLKKHVEEIQQQSNELNKKRKIGNTSKQQTNSPTTVKSKSATTPKNESVVDEETTTEEEEIEYIDS